MLAWDIETFGLDPRSCKISVICTECVFTGEKKAFEFGKYDAEKGGICPLMLAEFIETMDAAQSLSAFNGVRFDLPFVEVALGIPEEKIRAWALKTTDILEWSRLVNNHTFKLDLLCEVNDMPMKSGTGLYAITLAKDCRWQELNSYCADDVSILCNLHRKRVLKNPRTGERMDLAEFSHPLLYDTLDALAWDDEEQTVSPSD